MSAHAVSAVRSSHGSRARRRAGQLWSVLPMLGAALACDGAPSAAAPPPSRVEAVVAARGVTEPGTSASTPKAANRASAVRPLLCGSQLDSPGEAFKPALPPSDIGAPGASPLPKLELGKKGSWTWVNFWAAWCAPCKEELPLLLVWQKRFAGRLDFAFVSLDDDTRQLQAFIGAQPESGLRRSYWLEEGPARTAWLDALGMETEPELPFQLLIDPKGRLRCRVQGAVDERDLASLEKILNGD
jgi:thiol-disulfide isomerase/thioredoxin